MQAGLEAGVHDRALQQMLSVGDKAYTTYRGRFSSDALDRAQMKVLRKRG